MDIKNVTSVNPYGLPETKDYYARETSTISIDDFETTLTIEEGTKIKIGDYKTTGKDILIKLKILDEIIRKDYPEYLI